jgi:F-type H+-transporting ATPase subunit alpha
MSYTTIVLAAADDPAALQYIAPYSGCTMGEEFMENGKDALVIYDDLSKHAWAYRQVSLLLRRPPGREAYPGDLFYLHSRLLERAARMSDNYVIVQKDYAESLAEAKDSIDGNVFEGPIALHNAKAAIKDMQNPEAYKPVKLKGSGGSLTALPIIETLLGDVSAYVPTNVISITDGQIYLESNLFYAGVRPAINVGISVSRVGGDAQYKAVKQVAGGLRISMSSFRELAAFAQFGSDLDKATLAQLNRGQHLQEILKQPQYEPVSMEHLVIMIFAGTRGYADNIPLAQTRVWESALLRYLDSSYPEIGKDLVEKKQLTADTETRLKEAIEAFNANWK